jgi:membrane protease YdiL (CAAX protease family)
MTQNQHTQKTIRNLIFFVVGMLALPWLGWGLDVLGNGDPHNQQESLGWLFFIVAPLAVSLLLRVFGGDGWKDFGLRPALKGNGKWYAFALLFHPVSTLVILLIGVVLGVTSIPDLSPSKVALVGQAILLAIVPNVLKNIFEEFAWRGYLAPKVQSVIEKPLLGHVIVGAVWFAWHLPYYLVLLDPASIQSWTSLSLSAFLPLSLLSLIAASIVYGELRSLTKSVWPAVLIHTAGNILLEALILNEFYKVPAGLADLLVSPGWTSLASIGLFATTGLWLYRLRRTTLRAESEWAAPPAQAGDGAPLSILK